jgi:predicted DCC family thiol-disulfide oxidoreductase YuxK
VTGWAILYDDDCGFCRWSVDVVLRWDRRRELLAVPIASAEGTSLLSEVPERRRLESWHLRDPDGEIRSAGAAIPALLRLLPGGGPLGALAARMPRTVERLYALVARNRSRLGRVVGRKACSVDPSRRASSRRADRSERVSTAGA